MKEGEGAITNLYLSLLQSLAEAQLLQELETKKEN